MATTTRGPTAAGKWLEDECTPTTYHTPNPVLVLVAVFVAVLVAAASGRPEDTAMLPSKRA
jgi:hypothetical protein